MSYHHGPHDLRLAVAFEAGALISGFGDGPMPRPAVALTKRAVTSWREIGAKWRSWWLGRRETARRCSLECFIDRQERPESPLRRAAELAVRAARSSRSPGVDM